MLPKKSIFRMLSVFLVIVLTSSIAYARPLAAAVGTGFSYQGKLTDGGAPANGAYDLEFKLYDALSDGFQVGGAVDLGSVPVTNGLFTVQLDFGDVFDGTAYFLDIGVRPGGSVEAYTALIPRQPLSATPYAIYAAKAPWSGLSGVPAGFADGIDNGSAYQNVKVVAKGGGDFTTINSALDSITDASASNRYLVWVAPGTYIEQVTMKQYVDIEGAGELTTKISFTGSFDLTTGAVVGANDAELRSLTVENTGKTVYAIAIYSGSASGFRLTHVTAIASGGTTNNYGVYNNNSSPTMTSITASASGGTASIGVYNNNSSPNMTSITASAAAGTSSNFGVYNWLSSPIMTSITASAAGGFNSYGVMNNYSSPNMTNVNASASGGNSNFGVCNINFSSTMTNVTASASGGTTNSGVYNSQSSPLMTNVNASAVGGTNSFGVYNLYASWPTINNSVISASGGTYNYGIYNSAGVAGFVRVNNSQISASTSTISNAPNFYVLVGASQLNGGAIIPGAPPSSLTCAGVYDENYVFYASTCP